VHANTITFDESGALTGYDPKEFPSKAGGKAEAVKYIKSSRGFKTMAMVGDGATDVEARVPGGADIVVGYGGSQRRPNVEAAADWFVLDLNILREALTTSSG
jgi:phosphoserine phosphatase